MAIERRLIIFLVLFLLGVGAGCKTTPETGRTRDFLAGVSHAVVRQRVIEKAPGVADAIHWRRAALDDAAVVHSLLYAIGMEQPLREGCRVCAPEFTVELRAKNGREKGRLSLFCGGRAEATFQPAPRPPRGCRHFEIADVKATRSRLKTLMLSGE